MRHNYGGTGHNYDGTVVHGYGGMVRLTEHSMALVPRDAQTLHMVQEEG